MATKRDCEADRCIIQWKIENVSHCWWLKKGKRIESPSFVIDEMEGTKWSLWLYLMGYSDNEIRVDLHREVDCEGPYEVEVEYQLAILGEDGSILIEEKDHQIFQRDFTGPLYYSTESVLVTDREKFIPEDTLMVLCTLWNPEKERSSDVFEKSNLLYAETVINVNRKYFNWRIEEFSHRQSGLTKKFENGLIDLHLNLNDSAEELSINLISFHECIKYISCNTSIKDTDGKETSCGIKRYFIDDDFVKEMLFSMVTLPTMFMENRKRYLPNDVMTLRFDIVLSTVKHSVGRKNSAQVAGQEKSENTAVLIQDLKSMYTARFLCDTELRTQTQTFPAHMNILGARSPVFRRMFSHNMKEKNSGYVDITDLEDDTIHQMLQFIYTSSVENLQNESASKLHAAADKYQICSLKSVCSTFLMNNLCPTTACDVLILSDRNNDDHLKNAVQVYILEHDEVFRSLEWKHFMDTNIHLAADIMYMKVNPDNI